MANPTGEDGMMLLQLMSVYISAPMKEARRFWSTLPEGLGFDEMLRKYPKGSEELDYINTIIVFWDTIGLLLKNNLLNKDLVFDSFLESPWPKVKRFFEEGREKTGSPHEGENIEFAFNLAEAWREERDSAGA